MSDIERRSGFDRREIFPQSPICAFHHEMPDIVKELVTATKNREVDIKWLKRTVGIFMTILLLVVTGAFGSVVAINIQYNKDMQARDAIRNKIADDISTVKARVDVVEKVTVYLTEKDRELKELMIEVSNNLKSHTWEWQQDKLRRDRK